MPSGGLEIPLAVTFSISEEKSVILKHLQNLIDLNYKELTSPDTPQNEMIVEKELGQDYNPKMKTLFLLTMTVRVTSTATHRTVFIIFIKKEKKQFKAISFKAIFDVQNFGLQTISDVNSSDTFFSANFFVQIFSRNIPFLLTAQ